MISTRSLMLSAMLLAAPASAAGQSLTPSQQAEVDDFVVAASTFVLFHEIGHMLSYELDLPVVGREEDVADAIATVVMLSQDDEDDHQRAVNVLKHAITGWHLLGTHEFERVLTDEEMADTHSLKRQRAYQIVCFMYGSDKEAFGDIADSYALSDDRRHYCQEEFERTSRNFARLLGPFALDDGAEPNANLPVTYYESEDYAHYVALFKGARLLEELSEAVVEVIDLPRMVEMSAQECGFANAMYTEGVEEPEVILCYELGDFFAQLYIERVLNILPEQDPNAAPATAEQIAEADQFALSDAVLTLFHEAGHMLVGEFDLPVLGREEDAADAIATIVMLNQDDEDRELAIAYLEDAIEGWLRRDRRASTKYSYLEKINDVHSTSAQRGYHIACHMVGSDPEEFAYIAGRYDFDEERVASCIFDFTRTEKSWLRVLAPHVRSENSPAGGRVTVIYEPAEKFAYFEAFAKQSRLLEDFAETLEETFVFPRDINVIAMECDWDNAYYDPDNGDIVICYDLLASEQSLHLSAVYGTSTPELGLPVLFAN